MKRSRSLRLVLLGASVGLMAGCGEARRSGGPALHPDNVIANDTFVAGAGYYHAPFHAFYSFPYNHYDPARKAYFAGGSWRPEAHRSVINVSAPSAAAIRSAEAAQAAVQRSGFGGTGARHHFFS